MEVTVFTAPNQDGEPAKSELHGCQYLHAFIPGTNLPPAGRPVRYLLDGMPEQYRRKVYGGGWNGQVSPDEYGPEANHSAWDLRQTYDLLWERFASRIFPLHLTPQAASMMARQPGQRVFCTVPAPALCLRPEEHKFAAQSIWAIGTIDSHWREGVDPKPKLPPRLPYLAPGDTVQCNAQDAPRWYRAATVFGHSTLEWPAGPKPPISGVVAVQKPLSTDCDCHVGKAWHRLGRYGRWAKGVLVHEAYFEALVLR
jgi:hypothetical protein